MATDKRFAVLIDTDNVSQKYIKYILAELANDGVVTYKRAYGDWTSPEMKGWRLALLDSSIIPMQQFSNTNGKNATDSAMIIDAMDILYAENVDGFCLVSSDSDFTRLAARLRESGKEVIGMGEEKTPASFRNACNKFRYLEVLEKAGQPDTKPGEAAASTSLGPGTQLDLIRDTVTTIISENSDNEGKIRLSRVGDALSKRYSDFDVRIYGHKKLSDFITSLGFNEVHVAKNQVYISLPEEKKAEPAAPKRQSGKKGQ